MFHFIFMTCNYHFHNIFFQIGFHKNDFIQQYLFSFLLPLNKTPDLFEDKWSLKGNALEKDS